MREFIKRVLRHAGYDMRRFNPQSSEHAQLQKMLATHGINLVFDVGANIGQYARKLRAAGYSGRIVSFEPLSSAYSVLLETSRRDSLWEVAPRMALGSLDTEIEINISANLASSSILGMQNTHINAAPDSKYIGKEKVRLSRLDTVAPTLVPDNALIYLKVDTQGYEYEVLAGASKLLTRVTGLQLELSMLTLYEGQKLYIEMIEYIGSIGFNLWAIFPNFIDHHSGRLLQADAVFFIENCFINK